LSAWQILALTLALALQAVHGPGLVVAAETGKSSIVGTVVSDAGSSSSKPIAGVEVQLTFGSKTDSRKTGADGKYQFSDLLPGKYTIKVVPPSGQKPKGDASVGLTLDNGDIGRADFSLTSLATPTPTVGPTLTPTPRASPAAVAAPKPGSQTTSSQLVPPLVNPLASPPPSQIDQAAQQAARQVQQAQARPAVVTSPSPLDFGAPSLIAGATPGTPQATPSGTPGTSTTDDALASGPPRRLITSFEALRETAGSGAATQLKSFATQTSLLLGVPFRTQIDGTAFSLVNCGPASLAMVLTAFGVNVDPSSVRDYLNFLIGNYNTEQGTSLYVLGRIAREAGLNIFGVGGGGNLQGWTVDAVREQVRAGHPVITLTKYRRLPGHFGSVTEFDHYIVITGLAGEDFVYNDAAYATEYGYNLLISPAQLERAWADSSVPRHAMAVGLGDGIHPLPIVPRGLTAESLAAPRDEQVQVAPEEMPVRMIRGPAAERLREEMLDRLGSRTAVLDTDLAAIVDAIGPRMPSPNVEAPPTRLDPADVAAPADLTAPAPEMTQDVSSADLPPAASVDGLQAPSADAPASTVDQADVPNLVALAPNAVAEAPATVADAASAPNTSTVLSASWPVGLLLLLLGVGLTAGGGFSVWRRRRTRVSAWRPVRRPSRQIRGVRRQSAQITRIEQPPA
jgi:hypothetical protein